MSAGWGRSPWTVDLELPRREPPERCEVAVVGGGLAGLATARALAKRGVDVALLEAGRIGAGASGRSGGLVLDDTSAGPLAGVEGCLAALERIVTDERIDCELALPGCWELVHDAESPIWRDGEGTLSIGSTVPGGTVHCGKLLAGLDFHNTRLKRRFFSKIKFRQIELFEETGITGEEYGKVREVFRAWVKGGREEKDPLESAFEIRREELESLYLGLMEAFDM